MKYRTKTAIMLLIAACACSELENVPEVSDGIVTVGFGVSNESNPSSKSAAGPDGLSTSWTADDTIALWAAQGTGYVLDAVPFSVYSLTDNGAFFTAEIDTPMPGGEYTYYATYPTPVNVNGNKAVFVVPALQDGLSGGGEDIMVATPVNASALAPIDWLAVVRPELDLAMNHKLHRLRFYSSDTRLGGEPIRKLYVSFPRDVVGTVETDFTDPSASLSLSGGESAVILEPRTPVALSDAGGRSYLTASIVPTRFADGESMDVKLYTETKVATAKISLQGREFAAGHSTPVRVIPSAVSSFCKIYVDVLSNNLGEPVRTITFTAPSGCKWSDSGSETFVYNPGTEIGAGHSFVLEYEDESAFRTLSGKTVTATYDSEHVTISESLAVENLDGKYSTCLKLNVPYLLEEDFSSVSSFSSHDEYATSSAGSYSAYSFLGGWTGGRVGAEAGKCIRIACRRETSANYSARVDSAPLRGVLKKAANLCVEFDYGANNKFGGIAIITDGNVGQTCHIGYVTSASGFSSGASDGNFESDNSFYIKEYTGSWDNTPNSDSYIIHDAPASSTLRISWRTVIESQAGTTNTTAWLYIDNIKIKIKQD